MASTRLVTLVQSATQVHVRLQAVEMRVRALRLISPQIHLKLPLDAARGILPS